MTNTSLRQSDNWFEYLTSLGWKCVRTGFGVRIAVIKTPFGVATKIQRPSKFEKKQLEEIEKVCQKESALFIKIEPSLGQNLSIFENAGFVENANPLSPPSTIVINLAEDNEKLWRDLSRGARYSVRKAKKDGCAVEFFQNPEEDQLKAWYAVLSETSKKKRFYIQPYADLLTKKEIFKDKFIAGAVKDTNGELMSVGIFLGEADLATYIHGGTTLEGRKGEWGYALMWESILYLKSLGYTWLDLEGIDDDRFPSFTKDWGGFSFFKEKFGGKIVRFPMPQIKYLHPTLRFLSRVMPLPL